MSKSLFYVFLSLLLVVSCECKDMHWRKLPEEKDITFKGEVKADPSKKTKTYIPNEQREIQIHLASSNEEAKDAQFKILSATLADGSPADLDYTSLKLGYNTLHYTPQKPGTHEITLRVAVEGEGNVQTIHCPIEAPAANWQVGGQADEAGNIALTITNAPEEWRSESWRITNSQLSEGLEGRLEPTPTELHYGENQFRINLDRAVLTEPHVLFTVQGPDETRKTCRIDLIALCVAQLRGEMSEGEQALTDRLLDVNEYVQETESFFTRDEEGIYHLPPETVTDLRANREKQNEITTLLRRITAFKTGYEEDTRAFSSNLETLEQTQVNENLAVFEANNKRLKDAIASLKSAQVQLHMKCGTAHTAIMFLIYIPEDFQATGDLEDINQAVTILSKDPKMEVNCDLVPVEYNDCPKLTFWAARGNHPGLFNTLISRGAITTDVNPYGRNILHVAVDYNSIEMVREIIRINPNLISELDNQGKTPLDVARRRWKNASTSFTYKKNQIANILIEAQTNLNE